MTRLDCNKCAHRSSRTGMCTFGPDGDCRYVEKPVCRMDERLQPLYAEQFSLLRKRSEFFETMMRTRRSITKNEKEELRLGIESMSNMLKTMLSNYTSLFYDEGSR